MTIPNTKDGKYMFNKTENLKIELKLGLSPFKLFLLETSDAAFNKNMFLWPIVICLGFYFFYIYINAFLSMYSLFTFGKLHNEQCHAGEENLIA